MQKLTETEIKNLIKEYLKLQGFYTFWIMAGPMAAKGLPDRVAIKNDHVFFIEVKRENGKLSDDQIKFRDSLLPHCGGHTHYITARSLDDIAKIVREFGLESQPCLW